MIRVVFVDDHPALRAGLLTVLQHEPGLVPVGSASGERELHPLLRRTRPDVVLLDYNLAGCDGIQLCRRVKTGDPKPAVLMYTAYDSAELALPAALAGADGIVEKGALAEDLFDAIRAVARGEQRLPPISRDDLKQANRRIDEQDLPLLGLLLDRTTKDDIADVMRIDAEQLELRVERMLCQLRIDAEAAR
ncbi:MAG TPA: response regulator transcription factor [Candidatus Saccharimonadales bacterium]|nr:response regulator transcription factor [Candidatus Saccharimonadales bacterium]